MKSPAHQGGSKQYLSLSIPLGDLEGILHFLCPSDENCLSPGQFPGPSKPWHVCNTEWPACLCLSDCLGLSRANALEVTIERTAAHPP